MARRWLVFAVGMLVSGPVLAQPPAAAPPPANVPPPAGGAAPPVMAVPLPSTKRPEWPREIGGKSISFYIERLTSTDPTVREYSAKVLPLFGPTAARAASRQLVTLMEDRDPGVRVNAILALASIGFETKDDLHRAVLALKKAIHGTVDGSIIRLYAARALGLIGTEAYPAVDALLIVARDPAWETRDAAAAALGRVACPIWDTSVLQPPGSIPVAKRPASPQARSRLFELLKDPSQAVRLEAIQSLLWLGPPTSRNLEQYVREVKPMVDEVNRRLEAGTDKSPGEKDPQVRLWLHTLMLSYDDREAAKTLKEIKAAITAVDPGMRVQGLTALAVCGAGLAGQSTDEVRGALKAAEPDVARAAMVCVLKMTAADARKFVGDLQALAGSSRDDELKHLAAEAAKQLAPGAVPGKE